MPSLEIPSATLHVILVENCFIFRKSSFSVVLYISVGHTPQVSLSIKYLNPFITLLLPSVLLLLADAASFALPLGGGERNSFKVTLVLSFTMFLIILNEKLPGDSQCSPIIRQSARMQTQTYTLLHKPSMCVTV